MKTNSPEFRQMQRERIQRVKPWLKSTGAKTLEGKERSKMNALKISLNLHYLFREYARLMEQQKEVCKTFNHTNTL